MPEPHAGAPNTAAMSVILRNTRHEHLSAIRASFGFAELDLATPIPQKATKKTGPGWARMRGSKELVSRSSCRFSAIARSFCVEHDAQSR
jgi:hypothetical protein